MRKVNCIKLVLFSVVFFSFENQKVMAQVGVGTATPSAKSVLDITSTSAGVLFPRVTSAQRAAIAPAVTDTGLKVYDITTKSYWYWDGTVWVDGATNSNWKLTGNAATVATTNFIGTTDAIDFVTRTNNTERIRVSSTGDVSIGTNLASNKLHIVNNADGQGVLRVDNSTGGGFSGLYFYQGANYRGHIGYVNTGGVSSFGGKGYYQLASGDRPIIFSTNSGAETYLERMIIAQDGRVGINTNPTNASVTIQPTSTLQVNGSFAIKSASVSTTSTLVADVCKVILKNTTGAITITLPDPSTCTGRLLSFTRASTSSGIVTLDPVGTANIQSLDGTIGNTTTIGFHTITGGGINIQLWSDGAVWYR